MNHAAAIEDILPFTACQRFFLGGLTLPEVRNRNLLQYSYIVEGPLEEGEARTAWQAIVDAHPALRTSLHMQSLSQPFQVIHKQAKVRFIYDDLSHIDEARRGSVVRKFQQLDAVKPFDWHSPSLMRVALHKTAERRFILTVTIDHMIFDGWSLGLAIHDFLATCGRLQRGEAPDLAVAPSVRGYLQWQRGQDTRAALDWYRQRLADIEGQRLPFARPVEDPAKVCARELFFLQFTDEEDERLNRGAKRLGVTLNVLFQGAWALLLSRFQMHPQAYFVTSVTSRPSEVPGIQRVFNLLLGIIPYSLDCAGGLNVRQWLDDIHSYQMTSMDFHHVPPEDILALGSKLPPLPLTSCLVFQNMDTGETHTPAGEALSIRADDAIGRANAALVISAFPLPRFRLSFLYDSTVIDSASLGHIAGMLRNVMLELTGDEGRTLDMVWLKSVSGRDGAIATAQLPAQVAACEVRQ